MSAAGTRHADAMGHSKAAGISLGWTAAAALALAGCGNVVVDGSPGTGGLPGTPGSTGGDTLTITTSTDTLTMSSSTTTPTTAPTSSTGSVGSSGTGSGGTCVMGCDDAITTGTMPCYGIGFAYYGALVASACTCMECTTNLCAFQIPTASCLACVQANFPTDLQNCIEH